MAYKICPICGTSAHPNAAICATCGTSLAQINPLNEPTHHGDKRPAYEDQFGETDLLETQVRQGRPLFWGGLVVLAGLVCLLLITLPSLINLNQPDETLTSLTTLTSDTISSTLLENSPDAILLATNTLRPTMLLPTVTPAPPTATMTETPGPCEVVVQTGDSLLSLAYGCGHRSMDVIPLILELNQLESADFLQTGQTILIPLPTATPDPLSTPEETIAGSVSEIGSVAVEFAGASLPSPTLTPYPSATLLPGVQWYTVQPNDSIVAIAYAHETTAEVLSMLNPELPFTQCDFQYDSGGPTCTVLLQAGQLLRVPAPSPTPTLSPTLTGSETPTPTPTATYNAPSLISPHDRAVFSADEIVTLRWVTTGVLAPDERYRLDVTDLSTNQAFTALTTDLFFIVPQEWQGSDFRRHEYQWTISIVSEINSDILRFTTPARFFSWAGRGESP